MAGKNNPKMFRKEFSELLKTVPTNQTFRPAYRFDFLISISLSYFLFGILKNSLDIIVANTHFLVLISLLGIIFLICFYRESIKTRFLLYRFGPYENCVVPPYMYREGKTRPKRRHT